MSVISRFDRHAGLMERMADAVGVDLVELSLSGRLTPEEYRGAVFRCTGCTRPGACAAWTAEGQGSVRRPPEYCRNRTDLERLANG